MINNITFLQNDSKCYYLKIMKCFVKGPPASPSPYIPLPDVMIMKPVIKSVSFHRYGKEFAITIHGDNLWFSYYVKVDTLRQTISVKDATQKRLQFNCNIEEKLITFSDKDYVSVKVWSHFSSPVLSKKTEVKHKV